VVRGALGVASTMILRARSTVAIPDVVLFHSPVPSHGDVRNTPAPVEAAGLRKRYPAADADAVAGIDLTVAAGSVYGVLGPNGAGKTTTLSMLSGLLRPDGGTLRVLGEHDVRRARHRIGVVPQDLSLYGRLTCRENLAFFGELYGLTGAELDARIDELLAVVGLAERQRERVNRCSSGMKRRLNLAAGLVHRPELILLDEPTVGVDPQSRARIFEAVEGFRDAGATVLYSTHYMEEARQLCDRLAILDTGRVIAEGVPAQLGRDRGRHRLVFDVDGEATAGTPDLAAVVEGAEVEMQRGRLAVTAQVDADLTDLAREITRCAAQQGWSLSLSHVREPSLESLFLDLTGRSLRDD